ncbi:unnamed protein product [Prorocentrum cordatum]|uniref:SET domain-containing protein n=1 Tax=Prorocentrum cordatum TaxID=2364126 RepID=A0ABN9S0J9_9DINO|nr:unnamed protein product [Polarella glacialis]
MPVGLAEIERAGLGLEEVPGEGRCLVAGRAFAAGDVLLVERPLVRDNARQAAQEVARAPQRFDLLRGEQNLAAASLSPEALAAQPFLAEVETNSFTFGGKCAVFNALAMLNHACATSLEEKACFSILGTGEQPVDDRLEVKLVATRDLATGDPILFRRRSFASPTTSSSRNLARARSA